MNGHTELYEFLCAHLGPSISSTGNWPLGKDYTVRSYRNFISAASERSLRTVLDLYTGSGLGGGRYVMGLLPSELTEESVLSFIAQARILAAE